MHLHVGNGGHEDATQQVKQSCHHIYYYASLLQSRMYSTCAAIWHHRNSFQQTQIMGNTDVCRSSALEVQPLYPDTRWHMKHHIWYNKSLDRDPISYLLLDPYLWQSCLYVKTLWQSFSQQDDKKWAVLCLCDPPASVWYFEIADPMGRYFDPLSH